MKHQRLLIALALLPLCSCEKADLSYPIFSDDGEVYHDAIIVGERLDDPYSLENVTRAISELYPSLNSAQMPEASHLYIRFLPSGESDFDFFDSFDVLDHPMDHRIVREGDYFQDPGVPSDEITWQYTVVPIGTEIPDDLRYEVLDKCLIMSDSDSRQTRNPVIPGADDTEIDWAAVERKAYVLSGNEDMVDGLPGVQSRGGGVQSGRPKGRITILDEEYDDEPYGVAGVKISCNSFVKCSSCYTDDNGYYEMDRTFSSMLRYRLVFRNEKGFSQGMNLLLCPASVSTLGKASPEGVSAQISSSSNRSLFIRSVVNNAGYDYYSSCISNGFRIATPAAGLRIWNLKLVGSGASLMLQQGVLLDNTLLENLVGEFLWVVKMFLPDIILGQKHNGSFRDIYSEAVHHFAHASHFMMVGKDWWETYLKYLLFSFVTSGFQKYGSGSGEGAGNCAVAEMWAYYIQNRMIAGRYPETGGVEGGNAWFYPQIFTFLDERGMDRFMIFSSITADIDNTGILKDRMLSLYPEYKNTINQAFVRYLQD